MQPLARHRQPVECAEPILKRNHRLGLCAVDPEGKEAVTKFTRLHSDGKTSVVLCEPRTGRMHQIRVHLQYLGVWGRKRRLPHSPWIPQSARLSYIRQ